VKLRLDAYVDLASPLHRWEPRCKLVALTALIFAFSFVRELRLLPAMLAVSTVLYVLSRLPLSFLVARLRLPGFFFLVVALLLPFLSGTTPFFHLGPLVVKKEGCLHLLLITVKFLSILTAGIVLFGTTRLLTLVKAMAALGLPTILADMTVFSYRYLYEIGDNLRAMQTGTRLRGFRTRSFRGLGTLASLVGTLLVHSYERADSVFKAATLRGYGRPVSSRGDFQAQPQDLAGLLVGFLTAAAFVVAEMFLRQWGGKP